MEFSRTHLNAKDERDREIKQDLLNDIVVSVGLVAFTKLSDKNDLNPLLFKEDNFSEVHDDKVNISYSLGLLTKNMKTESDIIIYIEFFHKLAQEYSAGRYLARKCASSPCRNGGTCHELDREICRCRTGYGGRYCETENIAENFSLEECQDTLRRHYEDHLFSIHIKPWDSDDYVDLEKLYTSEYSAGRYLARGLDEGRVSTTGFSEVVFDLKEIFQFASGTSDFACRKILAALIDQSSRVSFSNKDYLYHPIILDFISEAGTCAEDSETYLTRFFKDGKLQLRQVTASTVVGFEKLPGFVKKKITTIDISGTTDSPDLFVRLWNSMHTCIHLTHLEMYRHVPPTISPQMEPLYSVNSFTTALQPPADDYAQIMMFLPNIRELIIYCDLPNISELDVFATNNYDRKIAEDTYYDKVVSVIIKGLVKKVVQLKVLNMTFDPRRDASKSVSRDTVKTFIRMLKKSGMMRQLEIISFNYCVFNESDLIEIITAISEFTSIMLLRNSLNMTTTLKPSVSCGKTSIPYKTSTGFFFQYRRTEGSRVT
eukprot:XP_011673202.1 PREDICTED: uncharacterized protein LOC105442613 [Strongylocentrotus purpuratus]